MDARNHNLLLAESDGELLSLLFEFLGSRGCPCDEATDAQEALDKLNNNHYWGLVVSYRLKGMPLARFLREVLKISPGLHILLASPTGNGLSDFPPELQKNARTLKWPIALYDLWTTLENLIQN